MAADFLEHVDARWASILIGSQKLAQFGLFKVTQHLLWASLDGVALGSGTLPRF